MNTRKAPKDVTRKVVAERFIETHEIKDADGRVLLRVGHYDLVERRGPREWRVVWCGSRDSWISSGWSGPYSTRKEALEIFNTRRSRRCCGPNIDPPGSGFVFRNDGNW